MPAPFLSQSQQQHLQQVLAPQLRQSLHLLQVPMLELQSLVQQEIQTNPTLEEMIDAKDPIEIEMPSEPVEAEDFKDQDFEEQFATLARLDDEWRDYFRERSTNYSQSSDDDERRAFFMNSLTAQPSLQEHLMEQLHLTNLSDEEVRAGEMIVGNIDENGYFAGELADMAAQLGGNIASVAHVLDLVRHFDPVGVGASDLRECLLLQLERLGKEDSLEADIIDHHLDQIGSHKYQEIAREKGLSIREVERVAHFIATLDPRPGRRFNSETASYVLPDVNVQLIDGEYVIMLNNEQLPRLRISKDYRNLMEDGATPKDVKSYIREKVQSGSFLIKSIGQRQDTIYRISEEIVKRQRAFLDEGISELRPLTMAEVAVDMEVHETTVSRAIANKYMQTPQGTFEMKYFFTPGYKSSDGKEMSNKVVIDAIAHMISEENTKKPLSDSVISKQLKEKGINVARRTVAKYREGLRILPSHLRRSH